MVAEAQTAGVLEESERAIISGIVRLADRPVREVMTPRTEVDWIDVNSSPGRDCARRSRKLRTAGSRSLRDRPTISSACIRTRDLVEALLDGRELDLRELARSAPVIPDLMDAMDALAVLRSADVPLALVHDEYGHFDGIVTPGSLLAALGRSVRSRRRGGRAALGGARGRQLARFRRRERGPARRPAGREHAPGPGLFDSGGLRPLGSQAATADRRDLQLTTAGSSRSSTWTGGRSTSCSLHGPSGVRASRSPRRSSRTELELPEPLLRIPPCRRAPDSPPARPRGRAGGGPGMGRAARPVARSPPGVSLANCSKRLMPCAWSASANFGPTPLMLRQLVALLAARKRFVDGCPDDLAGDVAGRCGGLPSEPSPFGFGLRVDHVRTRSGWSSLSCTRLTRPQQQERQ